MAPTTTPSPTQFPFLPSTPSQFHQGTPLPLKTKSISPFRRLGSPTPNELPPYIICTEQMSAEKNGSPFSRLSLQLFLPTKLAEKVKHTCKQKQIINNKISTIKK
ncbi:hypothetical protein Droror1_Dr00023926 [Drosera rotundifolia]